MSKERTRELFQMFRKVADVDLLKLENVEDFVRHSILSLDEVNELVNENVQSVEIEQFVIDHVLRSTLTRETCRDESVLDLYTSIVADLVQWKNLHGKQILCILTIVQGLLCEIERKQRTNLENCFVHACQILMGDGKGFLFNSQLYPQVVDYIIQLLFQHQHLYEILLDDQPQHIETIEENRTVYITLFQKSIKT